MTKEDMEMKKLNGEDFDTAEYAEESTQGKNQPEDDPNRKALEAEIARRQTNMIADQRNQFLNQVSELQARLSIASEMIDHKDKLLAENSQRIKKLQTQLNSLKAASKMSEEAANQITERFDNSASEPNA